MLERVGRKDWLQQRVNYAVVKVSMEERIMKRHWGGLVSQATGCWETQKENEEWWSSQGDRSGSGFKSCTSTLLEKWTRKKRSVSLPVLKLQGTKHTGWCSQHKSNYSKILTVVQSLTNWVLKLLLIINCHISSYHMPTFFSQIIVYCIFSLGAWDINTARHWLLQFSVTDHILNTCTLDYSMKTGRKGGGERGKMG